MALAFIKDQPNQTMAGDHGASRRAYKLLLGLSILASIGVEGCASATLSAGSKLASAGQAASTQMSQSVNISSATMQQARLALAFTDGYNGVPKASDPVIAQLTTLQANMESYSRLLSQLSSTYAALGSLASYDSAGSFNTAANGLAANINSFAKSVGSSSTPLPTTAMALVDAGGGQILANIQAHKVRKASDSLLIQLNALVSILSESGVRDKIVPSAGLISGDISGAALILYSSGAYSYQPLANQIGEPLGLTANASVDTLVLKNSKLKAGFDNVELEAVNGNIAAIGATYDASEKLLEALRPLHAAVDAGVPIDSSTITAITAQLQALAAQLNPKATASIGK